MVDAGTVTAVIGKELLEKARGSGRTPLQMVEEQGLAQVSDLATLREVARRVMQANPEQVATYRAGKTTILGWFVGQVMRETAGKTDAKKLGEVLQELLNG